MKILGSSKLTSGGAIGLLIAAVGGGLKAYFDGDPATEVDWNLIIIAILAAWNGFASRDNNRSSEDVGVRGPSYD